MVVVTNCHSAINNVEKWRSTQHFGLHLFENRYISVNERDLFHIITGRFASDPIRMITVTRAELTWTFPNDDIKYSCLRQLIMN